jgi:transcriptional regulator with XRE-family HTH domain
MKWYEDPEEIKKRRKLLPLTQAELAKAAKVPQSWLAMVELGQIKIGADTIRPSVKAKLDRVWRALATKEIERKKRKTVPLSSLLRLGSSQPIAETETAATLREAIAQSTGRMADIEIKLAAEWAALLADMLRGTITRADVRELLEGLDDAVPLPGRLGSHNDALQLIEDHIKIVREEISAAEGRLLARQKGKGVPVNG